MKKIELNELTAEEQVNIAGGYYANGGLFTTLYNVVDLYGKTIVSGLAGLVSGLGTLTQNLFGVLK